MSFELSHVPSLAEAGDVLDAKETDVALVDVGEGDTQGLAALSQARLRAPLVPMVSIGDSNDESRALVALQTGARGHLVKGEINTRLLVTTLRMAVESHRMILQLNIARERARHLANHDQLTGLANRLLFSDRLSQAVAAARRNRHKLAILFLDLDGFKMINDTLGHMVGAGLLRSIAGRLTAGVRSSDTAARLGGDEFAVLLTHLPDELGAAKAAGKILESMAKPMLLKDHSFVMTASIGISTFPRDGVEPAELVKKADTAMYYAKQRGRNRYEFYNKDMNTAVLRRVALESRLRTALDDENLLVYYQPQVDVRRTKIVGAEALIRWNHPDLGLVSPAHFLPLAEESGLIVPIGEWVLRTACQQNANWQQMGHSGFRVSVNVSSRQFQEPEFAKLVCAVLQETGLHPESLELEITESNLLQDVETTMNMLRTLKQLGIRLAIDDFGTGYSALAYLKRLPVDVLKIDQSFVRALTTDPSDAIITETVIRMAQGLNLTTIAEGVETREQLHLLLSYGCARMQGYLFGKPVPPDVFLGWHDDPPFRWINKPSEANP
jgi:diguanylate cyclase (GGDEF)-like protein